MKRKKVLAKFAIAQYTSGENPSSFKYYMNTKLRIIASVYEVKTIAYDHIGDLDY